MTGGDRNDARSASPGWTVPVDPSPPPAGASDQGQRILERLRQALYAVTAGEFRNQETRHDLDSRLGRELLYLIANDEWVQATTEFIDLQQAGTVHTTVRVEVNLDRIAHEALREQRDQLWLPLLVLPPYRRVDGAGRRPGGTVPVVTDAGEVRPTLPQAQLRRWVSAALAEIMLDGGAEWALPGPHRAVCREERILLGMAIRRFLRGQAPGGDPRGATVPGTGRTARPGPPRTAVAGPGLPDADPAMTTRLESARARVGQLLDAFLATTVAAEPAGPGHCAPPDDRWAAGREVSSGHAPVLVTRVMEALHAFGDDCVVVAVAVPDRPGPATFSVRLPGRALHRTGLHRLTPCARLELDLLVPSADADRQVLIRLPDGIGLTGDAAGRSPAARVEVRTGVPRALQRFLELWGQVPAGGPATLTGAGRCLAELALAQADLAQDVFRCHEPVDGPAVQEAFDRTQARLRLRRPGEEPGEFPVGTGRAGGAPADRTGTGTSGVDDPGADGAVLSGLLQAEGPLLRVAQVEAVGPRSVLVRLDAVEDAVLRGGVQSARVTLDVVAEDPAILRTARAASSGGLVVLGATAVVLTAFSATRPDPRVLATMLALFAAVQFSRLERPDRSTLRGLLTSVSAWIGVAGVLPSLLLGVATAFLSEDAGSGTEPRVLGLTVRQLCWGALLLQVVVQMLLTGPLAHRSTGRSALHRAGPPAPRMRLRTEPAPDHRRVSVLQGTWWRDMTGAALLLGRPSHACLVLPEGGALPQLLGTGRRPREVPCQEWIPGSRAQGFELTPDRLVPRVAPAGLVDVFLGLPGDEPTPLLHCHPVLAVLRAVADEGWEVGEVQLPVPAPPGGDPGRRWLRVRVCVDDGELRHLGDFLRGLARQAHLGRTGEDAELLVRGVPRGRPERLYPDDGGEPPSARLPHRHPVQVADLDGVSLPGPARDAPDWNVIGLCGGTRTGIESALLERAGTRREKLHLAGLTTSRLYGTTVVFLLGYRPGGRRTEDEPLQLLPRHPGDLAEVLHDSWVSATVFRLRPDQPVTDR